MDGSSEDVNKIDPLEKIENSSGIDEIKNSKKNILLKNIKFKR